MEGERTPEGTAAMAQLPASTDAVPEVTSAIIRRETGAADAGKRQTTATPSPFDVLAYQRDVLERTILFFDTLRRRANVMLEHERAGLPPLLNFKYETIARQSG